MDAGAVCAVLCIACLLATAAFLLAAFFMAALEATPRPPCVGIRRPVVAAVSAIRAASGRSSSSELDAAELSDDVETLPERDIRRFLGGGGRSLRSDTGEGICTGVEVVAPGEAMNTNGDIKQ